MPSFGSTTVDGRRRLLRSPAALLALVGLLAACGGGSDGSASTMTPTPPVPPTQEQVWDALAAKADELGHVPLILELAVDTRPEGELEEEARAAQRRSIAASRESLLAELEGTSFTNLKTFEAVPLVALHASPEAVEVLRRSEHVARAEEDLPSPAAVD